MLTRLGESGAEAFTVQRIGGHSSALIGQRYVHPTPERIEKAFTALETYNEREGNGGSDKIKAHHQLKISEKRGKRLLTRLMECPLIIPRYARVTPGRHRVSPRLSKRWLKRWKSVSLDFPLHCPHV
jgi:hypothetical protein